MGRNKFEWTDEKIEYLKDNCLNEKLYLMKKRFGCSWETIMDKAKELKLDVPKSNYWNEVDIQMLKVLADVYHYEYIAELLGRTPKAIYVKAKKIGIKLIQNKSLWTKEDEIFLKDNWGQFPIEVIAKEMKRSIYSIKVRAVKNGLGAMMANNLNVISLAEISDITGVSRYKISHNWIDNGLEVKNIEISEKCSYKAVTLKNLTTFLKNNQEKWDSRNLEKNILGMEPEWLKEKRINDNRIAIDNYKKWSIKELLQVKRLLLERKNHLDIAKEIGRSKEDLDLMFGEEKIKLRKSNAWTGKAILFLYENYPKLKRAEIGKELKRTVRGVGSKAEEMGITKIKKI